MKLRLAESSYGRVLLHLVCCLRRPGSLSWHWNGILREVVEGLRLARRPGNKQCEKRQALATNPGNPGPVQAPHARGCKALRRTPGINCSPLTDTATHVSQIVFPSALQKSAG
jgi:hypothetical protein